MGMTEVEKLIKIYQQLEDAGLMVVAGKKDTAELMVSHDVVPVVRCKDCKKWDRSIGSCKEFTSHRLPSGGRIAFLTREDDFCSYGERRTDG